MKSRIVAFVVVVVLILMVWGLVSIPGDIYGMPSLFHPGPEREIVSRQVESEVSSEAQPASEDEPAYYEEAGLFHFVDLNAVYAVEADDKTVQLVGREGTRVLDLNTGKWSFTRRKYTGPDIYAIDYRDDLDALKIQLPEWYDKLPTLEHHAYDFVWARCRQEDQEYLLVSNVYVEDVVDLSAGLVYRMPHQGSRFMVVRGDTIWLGGRHGIARLKLAAGRRSLYICPPRFEKVAGWVDDGNLRFVTSCEGDFMVIDTKKHAVKLLMLPEYLICQAFYPGASKPGSGPLWFSNPVSLKGKIYFAAQDEDHSAILSYDTEGRTWDHIDLPREMKGNLELILTGDTIWCAGGGVWGDGEGGDTQEFGGVAAVTTGNKVKVFPTLLGVPITGYLITAGTIIFQSAKGLDCYPPVTGDRSNQPEKYRQTDFRCAILLDTLEVLVYSPSKADEIASLLIETGKPKVIMDDAETSWLFRPAMEEVPGRPIDILRAGEENSDDWQHSILGAP